MIDYIKNTIAKWQRKIWVIRCAAHMSNKCTWLTTAGALGVADAMYEDYNELYSPSEAVLEEMAVWHGKNI